MLPQLFAKLEKAEGLAIKHCNWLFKLKNKNYTSMGCPKGLKNKILYNY